MCNLCCCFSQSCQKKNGGKIPLNVGFKTHKFAFAKPTTFQKFTVATENDGRHHSVKGSRDKINIGGDKIAKGRSFPRSGGYERRKPPSVPTQPRNKDSERRTLEASEQIYGKKKRYKKRNLKSVKPKKSTSGNVNPKGPSSYLSKSSKPSTRTNSRKMHWEKPKRNPKFQ